MTDAPRDDALTDAGKPVALAECPIGLFRCGDALCLKTEYGNNEGRIDAYIVSSGEFFWGDAPQTIASQRAQLVQPIELRRHRAPSAPPDAEIKALRALADAAPDFYAYVRCAPVRMSGGVSGLMWDGFTRIFRPAQEEKA